MKRIPSSLCGLLALGLTAGTAAAQGFGYVQPQTNPYGQPAVSPYLNLGRGGPAAINYYALVRPQLETSQALNSLQYNQEYLQQQQQNQGLPGLGYRTTGHAVYFFNTSHYFPSFGGGGGGSGSPYTPTQFGLYSGYQGTQGGNNFRPGAGILPH